MPSRVDFFRDQLLSRQRELKDLLDHAEASAQPVTLDQQSVGRVSRIDAIQQQQMAVANRQQAMTLSKLIAAALARIDDGSYGDCLECGEPIADARLEVQPWADRCIDCQSAQEQA